MHWVHGAEPAWPLAAPNEAPRCLLVTHNPDKRRKNFRARLWLCLASSRLTYPPASSAAQHPNRRGGAARDAVGRKQRTASRPLPPSSGLALH